MLAKAKMRMFIFIKQSSKLVCSNNRCSINTKNPQYEEGKINLSH